MILSMLEGCRQVDGTVSNQRWMPPELTIAVPRRQAVREFSAALNGVR